jgi:hypothetical protein
MASRHGRDEVIPGPSTPQFTLVNDRQDKGCGQVVDDVDASVVIHWPTIHNDTSLVTDCAGSMRWHKPAQKVGFDCTTDFYGPTPLTR